jgi:mannose-6-phosphate isomerase-like protein (cupin superfamily)
MNLLTGMGFNEVKADFQYRSDAEDLVFICITIPPWTGSNEASYVEKGAWQPTTI